MPFQNQVNISQAPAVAGDFCDSNPRHSVNAGPGAFVASATGVTVGRFAWADGSQITVANTGTGIPTGFVHREQGVALITGYLAETSNLIVSGFMVTLMETGGFWVANDGAGAAAIGMKAYANLATGQISFAAPGATVAGAVETKWYCKSVGLAGELVKMSAVTP